VKERRAWRQILSGGDGIPLPEPVAGLTSRGLFPSLELFDRTKSCGVLESRTASEMTDLRVLRLGRRVIPPGTTEAPIKGVMRPCPCFVESIRPLNIMMSPSSTAMEMWWPADGSAMTRKVSQRC
jgi:hypothetical protein